MLKILAVVLIETVLFTIRDVSIGVLVENFNFSSIGATSIFVLVCCCAALALYTPEILKWFTRTPSVSGIPVTNKAQTQPTITQPHSLPVSDLPRTDVIQTQPRITQSPTDRVYTNRTLGEIFESIKDCTSMQINSIVRPHLKKWLKVNYIVQDVHEFEDEISIAVEGSVNKGIFLRFQIKRWKAILETVKEGDRLIAEGIIESIDKHSIRVIDCEVIEIKPRESSLSKESYSNIDPNKCDES